MANIILEGCMLLILVVIFASYQSAAGIRKNLRMSVTLPMQYMNHPSVLSIVNGYKKANIAFLFISVISTIPIIYIRYTSIQLIYLAVWIGLCFVLSNHIFCNYNNRLLLLKSNNLWFIHELHCRMLKSENAQRKRSAFLRKCLPTAVDRLLAKSEDPILVDEDENWINGYYYNPEDIKSTVEKRVGIGTTMNLATKSGRYSSYAAFFFIVIILGAILSLFVRMDFSTFGMVIGDTSIEMKAPLYNYEFEIKDIEELILANELPKRATRTNGAGTDTYYLGHFQIEGYGSSMVYLYRNYPPYIIIRTKGKTIFFNTINENDTKMYYDRLKIALDNVK